MRLRNHNLILLLAFAVALVLGATACSSTMPAEDQASSAALVTKVSTRLAADPEVNPFEIDVDYVSPGVVRLRGVVEERADVDAALETARDTRGVTRVINALQIGDKTAGEMVDDAAITTKVKAKLAADLEVAATNIDVDTRRGVVYLSGMVKSDDARREAEKLARDTDGVTRVENDIDVQ